MEHLALVRRPRHIFLRGILSSMINLLSKMSDAESAELILVPCTSTLRQSWRKKIALESASLSEGPIAVHQSETRAVMYQFPLCYARLDCLSDPLLEYEPRDRSEMNALRHARELGGENIHKYPSNFS